MIDDWLQCVCVIFYRFRISIVKLININCKRGFISGIYWVGITILNDYTSIDIIFPRMLRISVTNLRNTSSVLSIFILSLISIILLYENRSIHIRSIRIVRKSIANLHVLGSIYDVFSVTFGKSDVFLVNSGSKIIYLSSPVRRSIKGTEFFVKTFLKIIKFRLVAAYYLFVIYLQDLSALSMILAQC
ncbi:GSCOCG00013032001-RA-CDS [Cotesia congregata]|nr:GSCOCG00013032001-RA-CDS [Cotesia congregata]